jgi:hypothetical protein
MCCFCLLCVYVCVLVYQECQAQLHNLGSGVITNMRCISILDEAELICKVANIFGLRATLTEHNFCFCFHALHECQNIVDASTGSDQDGGQEQAFIGEVIVNVSVLFVPVCTRQTHFPPAYARHALRISARLWQACVELYSISLFPLVSHISWYFFSKV